MPADGQLKLLSPASPWAMNSSYANDGKIRERLGEPIVMLHPEEASGRQLKDGQSVTLSNGTGRLTVALRLDDMVPRGVAYCPKGQWPKLTASHGNMNALVSAQKTDMGESTSVHSTVVNIAAA